MAYDTLYGIHLLFEMYCTWQNTCSKQQGWPLYGRLEVLLLLHKAYAFTAINLKQSFQVKVCNVPSAACQLQLCCILQLHASCSMLIDLHGGASGCCLQLCACFAYLCVGQVGLTMYRQCLCLVFTHTFNVQ